MAEREPERAKGLVDPKEEEEAVFAAIGYVFAEAFHFFLKKKQASDHLKQMMTV